MRKRRAPLPQTPPASAFFLPDRLDGAADPPQFVEILNERMNGRRVAERALAQTGEQLQLVLPRSEIERGVRKRPSRSRMDLWVSFVGRVAERERVGGVICKGLVPPAAPCTGKSFPPYCRELTPAALAASQSSRRNTAAQPDPWSFHSAALSAHRRPSREDGKHASRRGK